MEKKYNKNINNSKQKTNKSIKKNKKKKSKKGLIHFFVILLLILISYLIYFLCTSSKFAITQINVTGNIKYSVDEIINNSYIKVSKNIFLMKTSNKEKCIENLAFIKSAKVTRKFPNEVNIDVTERTSRYLAYDKDKNVYYKLDDEGVILEESTIDQKTDSELLTYGITFDDEVKLGNKINDSDLSKLVIYKKIEDEIGKSNIKLPITKLNFENSLTTIVLNDKLSIVFPNDTNLEYNIRFLGNIISKISEDSVGVIDMTKSDPTFSQIQ